MVIDFPEMRGWIGMIREIRLWQSAGEPEVVDTQSAGQSSADLASAVAATEEAEMIDGLPSSFFCPITRQVL